MHIWVIGSGGLLGSAVTAATRTGGHRHHVARRIPWTDTAAAGAGLADELDLFCAGTAAGEAWSIIWCAGVGVVGTSEWALEREEAVLGGFVARLSGRHPAGPGASG